ncbi:MAG: polyphosphate kinase 2 family protein [Planctomycetota bacterium]|nr:polyphosphate kinase 2 family protein [Planctomycetota bacterium]MDA1143048.1 polyphosphate kinase 2 family protein [Planctomycetota bacterium]
MLDSNPSEAKHMPGKEESRQYLKKEQHRLAELQEILYAQGKRALLIVFQATDTGGKDGTIKNVMGPLNPQGVVVRSFKKPTEDEIAHDYLWRIHKTVPKKGEIGIFNRSHYEDVIVPKVHGLVSNKVIKQRYREINAYEKYLTHNGTTVIKFFLHISKNEQKERLQERLDNPDKHWKFNISDLDERKLWDKYQVAFESALRECSTKEAPWFIIPANRKWYRNYLVARIIRITLEGMDLRYPPPPPGLVGAVIKD